MTDYPQATPDITEAVKAVLEKHKGKANAIKRDHLTIAVFRGECLDYDTNGNEIVIESYDRRIRDALSETAAVNTGTGYFLPTCRDEALQHCKLTENIAQDQRFCILAQSTNIHKTL